MIGSPPADAIAVAEELARLSAIGRDATKAPTIEAAIQASLDALEPALRDAAPGTHWQFLREGYFFVDPIDSMPGVPVWNRTLTLKDTWAARSA